MKSLKFVLIIISILTIFACEEEDGTIVTPPVAPETIGGVYDTDLHLINRNTDPNLADYYVNETISMIAGSGFIVDPGVVIEFAPNTRFQLGLYSEGYGETGYIDADGTSENPIVFRGIENTPGSWNGILIGCSSSDFRNQLNHCVIEYAGGINNYAVRIEDCTNGAMGLLSITNTTIRNTLGNGLESYGDNVINQFSNNVFDNNSSHSILVNSQEFSHVDVNTRFVNNGTNGVSSTNQVYSGHIDNDEEHVWNELDGGAYYINKFTRVYNGSLTISPGAEIIMGNNTGIASDGAAYISAVGTAARPITFRGENTSIPSWDGIYIYSKNSPNVFEYCNVSEAGADGDGAFHLESPFSNCCGYTATITNCTIQNNGGCGIYTSTGNTSYLTQSANTFMSNSGDDVCID